MTHKMHTCKSEAAPAIIEALRHTHGWQHDKVPLNCDFSRRLGEERHKNCPYCGLESSKFEDVPAEDVVALSVNQRASGYGRAMRQNPKDSAVLEELRALRAKVDAMSKGGKQ